MSHFELGQPAVLRDFIFPLFLAGGFNDRIEGNKAGAAVVFGPLASWPTGNVDEADRYFLSSLSGRQSEFPICQEHQIGVLAVHFHASHLQRC